MGMLLCEPPNFSRQFCFDFCFVLTRPRHVPTARPGALMESAFVLAATIGPGPSHHPHGKLLSNRRGGGLQRLESGEVEGISKACHQG